jgi:hypothetical protein
MTTIGSNQPSQWVFYKANIPDAWTAETFLVARDQNNQGAKAFRRFASPADGVKYLNDNRGSPLYEVKEHVDEQCKLYFDLDRPDTDFTTELVGTTMMRVVEEFLRKEFGFDFNAVPGVTCQLAQASTDKKTSVHMCCELRVASVASHKKLTENLVIFIKASPDKWKCLIDKTGKCIVDPSVYSRFRSFRALDMVKFDRDNALKPLLGSSPDIAAHLIGIYPSLQKLPLPDLPSPLNSGPALLQLCGSRSRKPVLSATVIALPASAYSAFEDLLNGWTRVEEVFGGRKLRFVAVTEREHNFRLRVDKRVGAACPYAGRCHANNQLYIILDKNKRSAQVLCHDDACDDIIATDGKMMLYDNDWGSTQLYDELSPGCMHAQGPNIKWTQDYDEPQMRELPDAAVVCVLAGMGIGKTVAMRSTLEAKCVPDSKVLIITHNRSLAAKLYEDFQHLGVTNYQDTTGLINDAKVVVCLDSLHRVVVRNYDVIVIDEAVSVFLHFNSSHMTKRSENSALLELHLSHAKSIYFVDATLDTTFMKNIVDYVSSRKGVTPTWVRNRHVRTTNRCAKISVCDGPLGCVMGEASLVFAAAIKVLDLLNSGQKVACCSSTKKFTEMLATFIATRKPGAVIKVYNASVAGGTDLCNVDAEWVKYDLLIYSPSISSGVSFVESHFDSVVAYFVNSPFTPGVETALQQLFRVRQLTTGAMHIFVHNTRPNVVLPCTGDEISSLLSDDVSLVSRHFITNQLTFFTQIRVNGEKVEYDRDVLSWQIVMGIIQTQNLSAMYYTDVLASTLKSDYGMPVTVLPLQPNKGQRDLDLAILQDAAKTRAIPEFDTIQRLTASTYMVLKTTGPEDLSLEDRAAMRLYDCQHGVWGVDADVVDEAFYKTLVMAAGAFDYYFHVKRFLSMTECTIDENRDRMSERMSDILHLADKNLELFKTKSKTHYGLLLSGQGLVNSLLDFQQLDALTRLQPITIPIDKVDSTISTYLAKLSDQERRNFRSLFGVERDACGLTVLQSVMKKAFAIRVGRQHRCPTRKAYHFAKIDNDKLKKIMKKYRPTFPMSGLTRTGDATQ